MEGEMEVKLDAGKTTRYNRKYRHKYGHQCWWKTHEIASRIGLGVTVGQMFRCSSRSPLLLCVRLVGGQLSLFLGQWACCILVRYDWCLQKALAESHIASDSFHTLTNTEPHAYDCYWLRLAFLWLGFALTKSRESGMEIARKMWEAGWGMWNESELDMLTFDGLFAKCLTTQDWSLGHFVFWPRTQDALDNTGEVVVATGWICQKKLKRWGVCLAKIQSQLKKGNGAKWNLL